MPNGPTGNLSPMPTRILIFTRTTGQAAVPALNRQNLDPNSFFVESGAYFRIRNVQLGYTLSPSLTNKWKIHKLRIYLSAQNPLTLFAYNGYTPEVGGDTPISTGIDYDTYPLSATYTGGLELNF